MKDKTKSLTVDNHADFRRSISNHHHYDGFDDIDEFVAADPILDHVPQLRSGRGAGRIFAILNQLEKGGRK